MFRRRTKAMGNAFDDSVDISGTRVKEAEKLKGSRTSKEISGNYK